MLTVADKKGNIIAPFATASVNVPDICMFDRTFTNLLELADDLNWNLHNSAMVLDAGFDSKFNKGVIEYANTVPIIKPNPRALRGREKNFKAMDEFEEVEYIYKGRFVIERCFAREDKYRKLALRYEKLASTFNGFRYLAYSMINYRSVFGKNWV